jgi:Xaa-Pro aminopeptidase
MVFTFEPGLYYPDRRIGVRIEDTMVVEPDGAIHPLVDYPKDLILPVSGS